MQSLASTVLRLSTSSSVRPVQPLASTSSALGASSSVRPVQPLASTYSAELSIVLLIFLLLFWEFLCQANETRPSALQLRPHSCHKTLLRKQKHTTHSVPAASARNNKSCQSTASASCRAGRPDILEP